jgi:hypothetical protein
MVNARNIYYLRDFKSILRNDMSRLQEHPSERSLHECRLDPALVALALVRISTDVHATARFAQMICVAGLPSGSSWVGDTLILVAGNWFRWPKVVCLHACALAGGVVAVRIIDAMRIRVVRKDAREGVLSTGDQLDPLALY